ncbi:SDR family oxidoreductase [Nocardioides lianchengensis]|uniref:NAD(P)H dehydrogenase (Quinone) n=1 Tax=Nocardioides lianchengensis TaxID=1045774 RepID=A0A1G6JKX3_9ACTN|nr:SDR family oxidoreductase [Nocardioides lianchengensis]NYG08706.1 NAD(P)H dehydrogenase (quinone) [Nocardioides lianchengensis]SDC19363.1 NAD(P)H dehydrogenase (quinone) [Nocardioides lianchengensis]
MTVLVTGTSGHLGRLTVLALLERGVPAGEIVATARDLDKIADLADLGVQTRRADYTDPDSLDAAFAGVDRAVLVSSNAVGSRVDDHRNVVDAAARAGVGLLGYTSILRADTSDLLLAADHRETEDLIKASGVPFTFLRNGWYLENYTENTAPALATGQVVGSAGDGRVSAAARADFAAAAAAVLAGGEHAGAVYELAGDEAFTMAEYAAALGSATGQEIGYTDLPVDEYAGILTSAGVPAGFAQVLADSDRGIAAGALEDRSGDLSRLIGRPTTPLADALRGIGS